MAIVLLLLFVVLPIAELYVIIQVGGLIGIWPTLALLLAGGFLGAYLARTQGRTAWRRFNEAVSGGRMPAREAFDGVAIILGGALLLSPGFITDIFGFLLLIPPTRALLRRFTTAGARRVGPTRPAFFVYDRWPGSRGRGDGNSGSGAGTSGGAPPPRSGSAPGGGAPPRARSRDYDFEGSAREIPDDAPELDSGDR